MGEQATLALRIVSACKTAEQFVSAFSRYCDQSSLFIATQNPKPLGAQIRFSLTLASGNPVMSGVGRVVESHTGQAHRFGRPGMRIRFDDLDETSRNWVRVLTAHSTSPRKTGEVPVITPPSPPAETRTPGSPIVLPANPLSRIDDESIEIFIECSLYEVTEAELAAVTFDEDTDAVSPMQFLGSAAAAATSPLVPRPPILPGGNGEFSRAASWTLPGQSPPVRVPGPPSMPPLPRPVPLARPSSVAPTQRGVAVADILAAPVAESGLAEEITSVDPPPIPLAAAGTSPELALPPVTADVDEILRRPRRFSVRIMVAVGIASAAIGVAIGYSVPRRAGRAEATAVKEAPVAASVSPQVAATETETASREPVASDPPRAPGPRRPPPPTAPAIKRQAPAPAIPAADACTVDIATRPTPVAIAINGQPAGESPLVQVVPCGRTVIRFSRARYQSDEKVVELAPGEPRRVSLTLERPKVALKVDTSPRGATVKVGGRRIGSGPASTQVSAFTGTTIEVSKDGYKTVRRSIKPGKKPERVSIKLVRDAPAKPPGKRPGSSKPGKRR